MSNGRDDRAEINFTVADRVALSRIETKVDALANAFNHYQNNHNKEHGKIDEALKDSISKKGLKWALGIIGSLILIGGTVFAVMR